MNEIEPLQADIGKTALEKFEHALDESRGALATHHFKSMTYHIHRLLEEDDSGEPEPCLASFANLLEFLAARPWISPPALGIDRRGIFQVSWAPERDGRADFSLQFLKDGMVRWYLVDARGTKVVSGAGTVLPEQVDAVLATYRGSGWWLFH